MALSELALAIEDRFLYSWRIWCAAAPILCDAICSVQPREPSFPKASEEGGIPAAVKFELTSQHVSRWGSKGFS